MKYFRLLLEFSFSDLICDRILVVPSNITFDDLHTMIQAMNNWMNYHLYNFEVGTGRNSFIIEPNWQTNELETFEDRKTLDSFVTTLESVFPKKKVIQYHYDYGDGWEIGIRYLREEKNPVLTIPYCATGEGSCPPEDVGGEGGFSEFLRVYNDVDDDEHEFMAEWGRGQGFEFFDVDKCNERLSRYEDFRAILDD